MRTGGVGEMVYDYLNQDKATAPVQVHISDGLMQYPIGHPNRQLRIAENRLLLDCANNEYSEFMVDANHNFEIETWRLNHGARVKIFLYTNTPHTLSLVNSFNGASLKISGFDKVSIVEFEGVLNQSDNTVKGLFSVASSNFDTTWNIPTLQTVGGIEKGTPIEDLKGKTVAKLIELMLFPPSQPPSFTKPSVSFVLTPSEQTVEVGTLIQANVNASYRQNDGGLSKAFRVYRNGDLAGQSANFALAPEHLPEGNTEYYVAVDYEAGINTKTTEDGVVWQNTISEGTAISAKRKYTAIRAMFYGALSSIPTSSDAIRSLGRIVKTKQNRAETIQGSDKGKYIVFAYPASYGKLKEVLYREGFNANVLGTFLNKQLLVSDANNENSVNYEVYYSEFVSGYESNVHYDFNF